MRKLLTFACLLIPAFCSADRLGSLRSNAEVMLSSQAAPMTPGASYYAQINPPSQQSGAINVVSGMIGDLTVSTLTISNIDVDTITYTNTLDSINQVTNLLYARTIASPGPGVCYQHNLFNELEPTNGSDIAKFYFYFSGGSGGCGTASQRFGLSDYFGNEFATFDTLYSTASFAYNVHVGSLTVGNVKSASCIGTDASGNVQEGTCGGSSPASSTSTVVAGSGLSQTFSESTTTLSLAAGISVSTVTASSATLTNVTSTTGTFTNVVLNGSGNFSVTEPTGVSGQVVLSTAAVTNGHYAAWSSSMTLIDGGVVGASGVTSVNSSSNSLITGGVTLSAGTNMTLTQSGSTITFTAPATSLSGGTTNYAMCWLSATSAGHCMSAVSASGACTCISNQSAPLSPAIASVSASTIAVTWTQVASENGYTLEASSTDFSGGTTVSSTTTSGSKTGLTVESLAASTTYYLRVGSRWTDGTTTYADTVPASTTTLAGVASEVAFDSTSISGMTGAGTPLVWNHTHTGSNLYTIVQCRGINSAATSVTIGGVSASFIQEYTAGTEHYLQYGLANPGTGSKEISVAFSAGNDSNMNCSARSFTGVAQSNSIDVSTAAYSNGQENNVATRNTAVANVMIVDIQGPATGTKDAGQTQDYIFPNASQSGTSYGSYKKVGAAGSQSMTWAVNWGTSVIMWTSLKPAP